MAQKPATTRIPRQLRESDVHGKGAAEIGWGTPGDFDRCRAFMRRHDVPGYEIDGACANLHRIATGEWPGKNAHKGHLATAAVISLTAAAAPDTANLIQWEGPLARIDSPTGDRRQFPRDTLTYQSFPQPFRFQRQGLPGHQGAVTVGAIRNASEQDVDAKRAAEYDIEPGRYVWGNGYFLDPKIVPEVNEAVHQIEHGVSGPSVDLDSFTAVLSKTLSGETVANMKRGRQRAATLVSVPAFADLRIKVVHPKELVASSSAEFAVNSKGWTNAPIAPREALFDADDAAKRIEAWAQGDPAKMASVFLWIADSQNAPLIGRKGYRLPWGDIIDGKPYLIYHAVYAAAALLQGAHGGLPAIPEDQKGQLRSVITSIYEKLAAEFGDDSIVAPWDHEEQQQASGEAEWISVGGDEYESYVCSFTAALEEFVRRHRYTESKHPRDKRKNDHAGEWIDTPHGPHGQIKVGGKWVYPPKRGEKGYKNPEKAARGIAKRGGGKPGGGGGDEGKATRGPGTHVVRKAKPKQHAPAPAAKKEGGSAPKKKAAAPEIDQANARRHLKSMQEQSRLERSDYLKKLKEHEVDNLVRYLGGTKHEDDDRSDMETEVLHQMEKDKSDRDTTKERERDVERAKEAREISHGKGQKTVVAKKEKAKEEPKPKEAPKKEAPKKQAPPAKKAQGKTVVAKKEHKVTPAQQKALENLRDMGAQAKIHPATRKVLEREGYLNVQGNLTEKGRKHVGGKEEEAPKTATKKVSEKETVEAGALRIAGELSKAKSREEVESIVADLKGPLLREVEANVGVASRGTLAERRQRLVDGAMTRITGRSKEESPKEEAPKEEAKALGGTFIARYKGMEVKRTSKTRDYTHAAVYRDSEGKEYIGSFHSSQAAAQKGTLTGQQRKNGLHVVAVVELEREGKASSKTIVAKKTTTTHKGVTAAEHKERLDRFETREQARDYLNGVKGKDLTDLENELGLGHNGTVGDRRDRIVERTVGARTNSKAIREKDNFKKEAPPKVETPKLSVKDRNETKKKENLEFLHGTKDEDQVVERLKNMKRSELIAAYNDEQFNPIGGGHDPKWTDDDLRQNVLRLWQSKQRNISMREDAARRREAAAARKVRLAEYHKEVAEADEKHREAVIRRRTENPLVVTGQSYGGGWTRQITEDTGPLGIPVKGLVIDADGSEGGYRIESGRVIRRNGVAYLIEDDGDLMADEMADFLESAHKDLPGSDRYMKGYVWAKGDSPDDAYWQARFGNPDHKAAASSGDGIMRFWAPGNREGLDAQFRRAKHEYGHNIDNLFATPQGLGSGGERWRSTGEADAKVPFPRGWTWDRIRKEPEKSKGSKDREAPWGVTDYGKSSWQEDFAESLDMYLRGEIGTAFRDGRRVPVYFRDLFPRRAAIMDELFPSIGVEQQEFVRNRGKLTYD